MVDKKLSCWLKTSYCRRSPRQGVSALAVPCVQPEWQNGAPHLQAGLALEDHLAELGLVVELRIQQDVRDDVRELGELVRTLGAAGPLKHTHFPV